MTGFRALLTIFFITAFSASVEAAIVPNIELEEKIAYQQGQFGALYAVCGSSEDLAVIGGSLANWRLETFQGYKGNAQELASVQQAFDAAAKNIQSGNVNCHDWIKQAAATWRAVTVLAQNVGMPSARN